MGADIPHAAHRYIFGQLIGHGVVGSRGDDDDDCFNDIGFGDASGAIRREIPEKGLFERHKEVSRELTDSIESLSNCYFDCPSCDAGPHCHPEDKPYVEYLEKRCTELEVEADRLKLEIGVLQRLANPELMQEVYEILGRAGVQGLQLARFLAAAQRTGDTYAEYRAIRKEAEQLISAVAKGAINLACLILKLRRTGVRIPQEIQRLARADELWSLSGGPSRSKLQLLRFVEEAADQFRAERDGKPRTVDLRSILLAAAKSLENWPVDFGCPEIEAATSTRQNSKKSAQIRAFGAQLQAAGVKIDASAYRAMAITMCVVADDSEVKVSEDDVRKALNRYRKSRSPNTSKISSRKTRASL